MDFFLIRNQLLWTRRIIALSFFRFFFWIVESLGDPDPDEQLRHLLRA